MRRTPSPEEIVEELRSFAAENYYQDTMSELLMDAANTIEILEHERQQLRLDAEDDNWHTGRDEGRWLAGDSTGAFCDRCGRYSTFGTSGAYDYCPRCGAKMEERGEE